MKGFAKLVLLCGLLAAAAAPAFADEVDATASGSVSGNTITLANGNIYTNSFTGISLGSFTFAPGPFTFSPNGTVTGLNTLVATQGPNVSFYATSVTESVAGPFTLVTGNGYFVINGKTVLATYTLSTSGGNTTFQATATSAATPEPSSLLLLGTGLVGAAGFVLRKRIMVAGGQSAAI